MAITWENLSFIIRSNIRHRANKFCSQKDVMMGKYNQNLFEIPRDLAMTVKWFLSIQKRPLRHMKYGGNKDIRLKTQDCIHVSRSTTFTCRQNQGVILTGQPHWPIRAVLVLCACAVLSNSKLTWQDPTRHKCAWVQPDNAGFHSLNLHLYPWCVLDIGRHCRNTI